MNLAENLQQLRLRGGLSQEELAEKLHVARQTVGKWETGQAVPELAALIALSDLHHVPIDRLVRPEDDCAVPLALSAADDLAELPGFLLRAKRAAYAGHGPEVAACRPAAHDLRHAEGDWLYLDSYLGGSAFVGEEAVWLRGRPVWGMNYAGRVVDQPFSGDFLKEALYQSPAALPLRGPAVYCRGDWAYHCVTDGELRWFAGREEILCAGEKVYEARFHGGIIRTAVG